MGNGQAYKYPHEFEGHYVPESYLPEVLDGQRFYEPSTSGHEAEIGSRLAAWRTRAEGQPGSREPGAGHAEEPRGAEPGAGHVPDRRHPPR
jgi:putative ATPase